MTNLPILGGLAVLGFYGHFSTPPLAVLGARPQTPLPA
jgi:hypothetical protein